MTHPNITDEDLAALIKSTAEAASAYMRGDIRRYLALIKPADDHTLMAPAGGRQVHRHADPLVHGISLEQAAVIARGEASDTP